MTILTKTSAEHAVYVALKQALYARRLAPGTTLTERSVCNAYGVGHTPVRAAFRRLAQEGFVELIPNRGASVVTGSRKVMLQYYEARTCVLMFAVRKSIDRYGEDEFQKMEELTQRENEEFANLDFSKYLDRIDEFFLVLLQKPENPLLNEMYTLVNNRIRILLVLYDNFYMPLRDRVLSVKAHREIIMALREKQADMVESLLTQHYIEVVDNLSFEGTASASIDRLGFTI